jgi:hypothetical protein
MQSQRWRELAARRVLKKKRHSLDDQRAAAEVYVGRVASVDPHDVYDGGASVSKGFEQGRDSGEYRGRSRNFERLAVERVYLRVDRNQSDLGKIGFRERIHLRMPFVPRLSRAMFAKNR